MVLCLTIVKDKAIPTLPRSAQRFRLQSLHVEGIIVQALEVLVIIFSPRLQIDGVLGSNFPERFHSTFDFDTTTLKKCRGERMRAAYYTKLGVARDVLHIGE